MKRQIKKTIAILLIVCFVLSITAAAESATKGNSNDEKAENSKCYCTNPNCYVVPFKSNERIYKELSIEWWKWAESIPKPSNPILAPSGRYDASIGQSGDVWFLAGTFNTIGVVRTVEIPAGKALFIPIFNVVAFKDDTPDFNTKEQRRKAAEAYIDQVTVHKVKLDDKKLDNYRVESKPFEFTNFPTDDYLGLSSLTLQRPIPAVSDGYWIMLKPLPVGKHTIIIDGKAEFPDGSKVETQVTYNIKIKPEKH